jgi:glyoxylase-like metal-dependent hydrolase (beta-lactamase superfamily II)
MRFEENKILQLGDGVFIRNAVDNAAWADLGDGAVEIDALEDPKLAPVIEGAIQETTGKPLKWLINTHWHPDHIACNPAWAAKGVTIIAHESCGGPTDERTGEPNVTFHDRYVLRGAERQVECEWLGGTHTPWDTVVYFPWAKVLHIADLFGWGMIPLQRLEPEKITRLHEVLNRVLQYDAQAVVCGHGPVLRLEHVRRWLTYFDDLLARVPPLARAGKSVDEIEREIPPPPDMADWWRFVDWKHRRNLEMVAAHRG